MRIYHEITNVCNRHCSFCPGTKRTPCFVKPECFAERLEKTHDFCEEITFHVMGEPLLHPDFGEISQIALQNGIPVNLTTNGTLLNESLTDILLNNPIFRQINFSLQALADDEKTVLEKIVGFSARALKERPELYLNFRLWNLNDDFNAQRNMEKIRFIYEALKIELPERFNFSCGRKSRCITGRIYLNCDTVFDWPVNCPQAENEKAFCHGMSLQTAILVDGTVVPCCLDSEGEIALGNIDRESFAAILNSDRAKAIAQGFQNGHAVEGLCRKCTFRKRFEHKTE